MSALHLLDDFIECKTLVIFYIFYIFPFKIAIETLPSEIQQQLQLLHEKDFQMEGKKKKGGRVKM